MLFACKVAVNRSPKYFEMSFPVIAYFLTFNRFVRLAHELRSDAALFYVKCAE